MIPSFLVTVDRFPLTPNGKIDRHALHGMSVGSAYVDSYAPPRTEMEILVAAIWKELLILKCVGRHDNFFNLGGHSLLSMKVIARIENETGERMNPQELMFQTLEQFAAACDAQRRSGRSCRAGFLSRIVDRLKGTISRN